MAPNYKIAADVIDITIDTPKPTDVFYTDTNAWVWATYTRITQCHNPPANNQLQNYPNYISSALSAKAILVCSGYTLVELAHRIEVSEYEIYIKKNCLDKSKYTMKEYRHDNLDERMNVYAEIKLAWNQIDRFATFIESRITQDFTCKVFNRLQGQSIDGYDAMILETLHRANQKQVITDDGDFATVAGIQVFTNNRNVISAAKRQGRFVER